MPASASPRLAVTANIDDIRAAITRDLHRGDMASWTRDVLKEHLWSKQVEIANSVLTNRRTIWNSCHSAGKSHFASRVAVWWNTRFPLGEAFVVTTAPTDKQVKAVIWRYIGRAHAKGKLPGRVNQSSWWAVVPSGNEEEIALGSKPRDLDIAAFQGIHARHILVVIDEASGVHKNIWVAANSLISNANGRLLAITNPDDPTSYAAEVSKPGSGWAVHHLSMFDTPNFTGEPVPDSLRDLLASPLYEEECRREWGVDNPLYISKILGRYPEITTDGLIPLGWIREAQNRDLPADTPIEIGLDVGGGGSGRSVTAIRRGSHVRILRRTREPNTMTTLGQLMLDIRETGASIARVDYIGIGKGVVDRAQEIAADQSIDRDRRNIAERIIGVNVGLPAANAKSYVNARAEGYWGLRKRFEEGEIDIDPDDDNLASQLAGIRTRPIAGRHQIESKDEMRSRGVASPDDADAVLLAFISAGVAKKPRAVWGTRSKRGSS